MCVCLCVSVCVSVCSSDAIALLAALSCAQLRGISSLKLMMDGVDVDKNRGFCFVTIDDTAEANAAFHYLASPGFHLDDIPVAVEWAEPLIDVVRRVVCIRTRRRVHSRRRVAMRRCRTTR